MLSRVVVALVTLAPSALAAQSLARRVEAVPDGTVRFSYASRPGVCGDGRETIRSGSSFMVMPNMLGYGHSDMDVCFTGPVRVAIGRADGESVSFRVHVGGRWSTSDDATDLGIVSAPDAATYLFGESRRASGHNSVYALAAAVFADSVDLSQDLARLARDADAPRELRQRAVFWIGSYDEPSTGRLLHNLAADDGLDEEIRGGAIIALGRDGMTEEDVAWLRDLYPRVSPKLRDNVFLAVSRADSPRASRWLAGVAADPKESEHTRQQAMFWLGQGRGPSEELVRLYDKLPESSLRSQYTFVLSQRHDREALDKLIDIAQHDSSRDVRHQALFWLGQSKDPRAIAFLRDLVTR